MFLIELNKECSQKIIHNLYNENVERLSCLELLDYLEKTMHGDSGTLFLRESLCASLLQDLQQTFLPKKEGKEKSIHKNWLSWLKWVLLAFAGTIYAACDGFDGITTILALFPTIPLGIIFAAGFAFALLSVLVFYGFYLVDVSDHSDIAAKDLTILMDVHLEQMICLNDLARVSQIIFKRSNDLDELNALKKMLPILGALYSNLQTARKQYEHQLQNSYLNITKAIVAIFSGILFFGYGFFAGQSLALTVFTLVVASPVVAFWPVMAISTAVGLAALSIYWFIERPGLQKLVARLFGLDENKIEQLPDQTFVDQQKIKIGQMERDLDVRLSEIKTGFFNGKMEKEFSIKRSLSDSDIVQCGFLHKIAITEYN
jgi:hypothetical protein